MSIVILTYRTNDVVCYVAMHKCHDCNHWRLLKWLNKRLLLLLRLLKKKFKMSCLCLQASPELPLGNGIVDNHLQSCPHARLTLFLPHYDVRNVEIWIRSIIKCRAWCKSKCIPDTNPWCKRSQAMFVECVGGSGSDDYRQCRKFSSNTHVFLPIESRTCMHRTGNLMYKFVTINSGR